MKLTARKGKQPGNFGTDILEEQAVSIIVPGLSSTSAQRL